ncbi:Rossmann-like and DUF2520 domain-containing protein [Psychroflexus planctonicus]|uniref:DUF2520 domain-containing protein n=1 Tax=Psychroflexus planctonicus TaxID=1526575 RepID=A0ABQ1SLR5_9FLAO|nr:DUF2520 domain-containing protein [Psychroflexus planctonicus]GGE42719.1 hypothetical protein GCM10010832_23280 [Psychroflexus planctonicus]
MIKTVLIGFGNVGFHIAKSCKAADEIELLQIYNRSEVEANLQKEINVAFTTDFNLLQEADVYIIAVKDDAIEKVVKQIPFTNKIVAHTSGSLHLLNTHQNDAVFYPLQTFTKNKSLNYKVIPFCLEAENEETYAVIEKMAKSISPKVYSISTAQRQELHLSAVFVCNFVNHLYAIGEEICKSHQIPFEILEALIEETANKIKSLNPVEAQTGPALRQDQKTINRHLDQLKKTNYTDIYQQLSNSIAKKHGNQL